MLPYNKSLKTPSQRLRREMTDAERKIWQGMRGEQLGSRFNRQKPVANLILDFYCAAAKLVVEIDGAHHFEAPQLEKDRERDDALTSMGLKVMRFDDRQVLLETSAVLEAIRLEIVARLSAHRTL